MITKKIAILFGVISLVSCASQAPLDDAYYWPDKKVEVPVVEPVVPDNIEIINDQDTIVTIRVKK